MVGLVALDEVLPDVGADRARAAALGAGLEQLGFEVEPAPTNLLYFSLGAGRGFTARELVDRCGERGVRFLVVPGFDARMRMVTHHQVSDEGVERVLAVIGEVVGEF